MARNNNSDSARRARWERREESFEAPAYSSHDFFGISSSGSPEHIGKVTGHKLDRLAEIYGMGGLSRRSTRKEAMVLIKENATDEQLADMIELVLRENGVRFNRPDRPSKPKRKIDLD